MHYRLLEAALGLNAQWFWGARRMNRLSAQLR